MSASFATNWTLGEDDKKRGNYSKQKGKRYPVAQIPHSFAFEHVGELLDELDVQ